MQRSRPFVIRPVNWLAHQDKLCAIRRAVFVEEQHVPEELEWDAADRDCYHVLAINGDGVPIGTGRLLPDGHIGRMAVLKEWRRKGVGSAILETLLGYARVERFDRVSLHAQTQAMGFYRKHGFAATGPEFLEAGIPHRHMEMRLEMSPVGPSQQRD